MIPTALDILYESLPARGVDDVGWALAVSDFWRDVDDGFHAADFLADEDVCRLAEMPYDAYLETPEWRARARAVKGFAGGRCQACNSPEALHAHHRTYARRGYERWDDLIALCGACHEMFHQTRKLAD